MLAVLLMCSAIFLAFDLSQFTANQNLISILALVMSYWLVSTSIVYLLERAFDEPSVGQLVIMCTNALIGMITLMTILVLQLLHFDVSTLVWDQNLDLVLGTETKAQFWYCSRNFFFAIVYHQKSFFTCFPTCAVGNFCFVAWNIKKSKFESRFGLI